MGGARRQRSGRGTPTTVGRPLRSLCFVLDVSGRGVDSRLEVGAGVVSSSPPRVRRYVRPGCRTFDDKGGGRGPGSNCAKDSTEEWLLFEHTSRPRRENRSCKHSNR